MGIMIIIKSSIAIGDMVRIYFEPDSSWYHGEVVEVDDSSISLKIYFADESKFPFNNIPGVYQQITRFDMEAISAYSIINQIIQ
jgi:hypothetical protein